MPVPQMFHYHKSNFKIGKLKSRQPKSVTMVTQPVLKQYSQRVKNESKSDITSKEYNYIASNPSY